MLKSSSKGIANPAMMRRLIRWSIVLCLQGSALANGQAFSDQGRADAVYGQYCAQCHGTSKEGKPGVPDLRGDFAAWGRSSEAISQTIRHGIRATGQAGTRGGVMPSFKTNAAELSDDEIYELADYILQRRRQAVDAAAALRGQGNFEWCIACHGQDARGQSSVGGSNLLAPRLLYGDSRQALFESIAHGRAGVCPPWEKQISADDIAILARKLAGSMTKPPSTSQP